MLHGNGRNGEHTEDLKQAIETLSEVYLSDLETVLGKIVIYKVCSKVRCLYAVKNNCIEQRNYGHLRKTSKILK